ncbi:MAG TPA: NAD-glutamate dehydrogenase domain-containing protein, partial [Steroidobacteraceae bacterium]|nr:NAD-glutamate dehydrogenase domain-containing protein [Steroidobacteraceae bacterium]
MHARVASDDSRLLRSIPAARVALIERIARAASGRGSRNELHQRFLRGYFHGVAEEDLAAHPPGQLAKAALAHLALGMRRAPGRALVRVFNPVAGADGFESPHTLVLTVTDDMPFLVDSLGMALSGAGLAVHLIVHPVLQVRRDGRGRLTEIGANGSQAVHPESWQLYEIDRATDPQQLEKLRRELESTLADVRAVVSDFMPMRERVREIIARLETDPPPLPAAEVNEARHLLDWMEGRHFVFLGYRHYRLERGRSEDRLIPDVLSSLGVLARGRGRAGRSAATVLRGDVRARARDPELLIVTKANSIATVHRAEYLDYVGIKTFDSRGLVDGEHRFLGLWTSTAYHGSPREIPVLRRKVERVIEHFGLDPASHDGKEVLNVLETYPRDELFQADIPDLIRIVRGVVNLYERRTVRLLVRRDPYQRFYSCLVYVPRDRYNTEVRQRIERIATEGFAGTSVESNAQISGSSHARVHVVVRTDPARPHKPDFAAIERRIAAAALTWSDRLRDVLTGERGEAAGLALFARYRHAFPMAYQDDVAPETVLADLADLETLRNEPQALRLKLYRPAVQKAARLHLKIVKLADPVPISDILPMLENFGLRVISERPYQLAWPEGGAAWIQDFELEHRDGAVLDIARVEDKFREAFLAAWSGAIENDGFNRLVLGADLSARQIVVLRACCRYLLQTGVPFSQIYMERTLAGNAAITHNLVRLFETRFDPATAPLPRAQRAADNIVAQIRASLDAVASLDDDRILRAYLNLVRATLRTNYYQPGSDGKPRSYLSFKLDPAQVPDLPLPRPKFEIFVYSPRVEGVHLRMGYVARGGIRWSDRPQDFRTEILGLVKAQNVKNAVIVPVGAKGG